MRMSILVMNGGSSSLKFSLFDISPAQKVSDLLHGQIDGLSSQPHFFAKDAQGSVLIDTPVKSTTPEMAFEEIWAWLQKATTTLPDVVGHRVVHGGTKFTGPVRIDQATIAALEELVPLAPLHQPHSLAVIKAVTRIAPRAQQIACFDTSFHASMPPLATCFALPRDMHDRGIRRYGFHGLSYEYIAGELRNVAPDLADAKIVVAHLGSGASLCALERGRSIATTMSFTPLDGIPMGTRSGAVDPGVVLYLLQHEKMEAKAVEHLLYEKSGLLGVSGISNDMRKLLSSDRAEAREAIELFVYQVQREIGSLAAALRGLDGLVFTGGIGEKSAEIRARACDGVRWLGVDLDSKANDQGQNRISKKNAKIAVFAIPTDENLMIARHAQTLLNTKS